MQLPNSNHGADPHPLHSPPPPPPTQVRQACRSWRVGWFARASKLLLQIFSALLIYAAAAVSSPWLAPAGPALLLRYMTP